MTTAKLSDARLNANAVVEQVGGGPLIERPVGIDGKGLLNSQSDRRSKTRRFESPALRALCRSSHKFVVKLPREPGKALEARVSLVDGAADRRGEVAGDEGQQVGTEEQFATDVDQKPKMSSSYS